MRKLLLIVAIIACVQLQAQKMAEHNVQRHDNLFRISLQYNSTTEDIIKANPDINPQKLKTGSIIMVPEGTKIRNATMAKHTVERNDNLFRISLQYNSTADDIIRANPDINPTKLETGSILLVPENTKMRDAAFVASMLDEKETPAPTTAEAKPKKSKRSSFKTDIAVAAKTKIKQEDSKAVYPAIETAPEEAISAKVKTNKSQKSSFKTDMSVAKNKAIHKETKDAYPAEQAVPETDESPSSSSQLFTSEDIQRRYEELKKIERHDNNVTIVDMNKINVNQVTGPAYSGSARQLSDAINSDRVMIVNLQIVLKDGTVKTYSDPEDQKRVLSQIAADLPVR